MKNGVQTKRGRDFKTTFWYYVGKKLPNTRKVTSETIKNELGGVESPEYKNQVRLTIKC